MRRAHLVWLHRWGGLFMAPFLAVAGLTGSLLAFAPELAAWSDPPPTLAIRDAPLLDGLTLRDRALALAGPGAVIQAAMLRWPAGQPYTAWVEPRAQAGTGAAAPLGYDSIRLDPYTGAELDRVAVPAQDLWPITRRNFLGVVVALHRRLAIPGQVGVWLLGLAALAWTLDCFVALVLTFPAAVRRETAVATAGHWLARWWDPSWLVKWGGSAYRVTFDLHRAGGLWPWALCLAIAWSSVGFNLRHQIYLPVMEAVLGYSDVEHALPNVAAPRPDPGLPWPEALARARRLADEEGRRRRFALLEELSLDYHPEKGAFLYWFRSDRDIIDQSVMSYLAFDATDGRLLGVQLPTGANAGVTLNAWAGALHFGMVGGLPYRILLSLIGLVVTMLSVTGVWLWWKKRDARRRAAARP